MEPTRTSAARTHSHSSRIHSGGRVDSVPRKCAMVEHFLYKNLCQMIENSAGCPTNSASSVVLRPSSPLMLLVSAPLWLCCSYDSSSESSRMTTRTAAFKSVFSAKVSSLLSPSSFSIRCAISSKRPSRAAGLRTEPWKKPFRTCVAGHTFSHFERSTSSKRKTSLLWSSGASVLTFITSPKNAQQFFLFTLLAYTTGSPWANSFEI